MKKGKDADIPAFLKALFFSLIFYQIHLFDHCQIFVHGNAGMRIDNFYL
jgi:hypothetical protein